MLLITCPHCGPREEIEFRCGGETHIVRPAADAVSDDDWGGYLFTRKNPKDVHYERWHHSYGCRRWFNVARHTVSHRIEAVYAINATAPSIFTGSDAP